MAREKTQKSTALSLDKLIPIYGRTKAQADEYTKAADIQNKRIKEQMSALLKKDETSTDYEADGWIATYQVRTKESFNEEALVEFAKKNKLLKDCVKTVEVIDMKKLEDVLYTIKDTDKAGKQLLLELDKFRTRKDTAYLYIKHKEEE